MKTLLRSHIERDVAQIDQRVQAFAGSSRTSCKSKSLTGRGSSRSSAGCLLRRRRIAANRVHAVSRHLSRHSNIGTNATTARRRAHRRVLTNKEPSRDAATGARSSLLKIPANFDHYGMDALAADKARKEVNKRRHHFNMSKTGFVLADGNDSERRTPRDVLWTSRSRPTSKILATACAPWASGQSLGRVSLTIILYGRLKRNGAARGRVHGCLHQRRRSFVFGNYNQLNRVLATVPGNYALNLRQALFAQYEHADLSFLFTILRAKRRTPISTRSTWPCSNRQQHTDFLKTCITAKSPTPDPWDDG